MQAEELSQLQVQANLSRVRGVRVVGCTTTGAAMHHALLTEAGCGVVVVEEAAEVLEAHVLTALGPSTKHLIMIGETHAFGENLEEYRSGSGAAVDSFISHANAFHFQRDALYFEAVCSSLFPSVSRSVRKRKSKFCFFPGGFGLLRFCCFAIWLPLLAYLLFLPISSLCPSFLCPSY